MLLVEAIIAPPQQSVTFPFRDGNVSLFGQRLEMSNGSGAQKTAISSPSRRRRHLPVESDGKYKRVVCKFCNGHQQIKHAAKCRRHTITCAKVPKSIKDMLDLTANSSKPVILDTIEFKQSLSTENGEEEAAVQMIVPEPNSSPEPQMDLVAVDADNVPLRSDVFKSAIYNSSEFKSQNSSSKHKKDAQTPRMLTKGGRNRNSNILSATLCLIKELDLASLEVLDTAIHCRMEEIDQSY